MKELQDIIVAWKQLQNANETAALATLVKVEGSAYRRPGARMLVTSKEHIGTISGGCLENDVVEQSQVVLETGRPTLVKYDTTNEDDLIWGLGLGCQGVAYILIERLEPKQANALNVIEQCFSTRRAGAVATIFNTKDADSLEKGDRPLHSSKNCILLSPDGSICSTIANYQLEKLVLRDLRLVLQQKRSATQVYSFSGSTAEVFLEVIQAPVSLVVFGAGFDVLPVVHFAKALGWRVTLIDPQARSQTIERFKRCDRIILDSVDRATLQIEYDARTVAVVMSHNYLSDLEFLQTLDNVPLKYFGVLGPKKRTNRLLQDLKYEDRSLPKQLYSPVGLDIGADNPESIALSIIAEIQAVMHDRQGGFLKDRPTSIHSDASNCILSNQ